MTDISRNEVANEQRELDYLSLLRDEGLRLLAVFKTIDRKTDRDLVIHLAEALAALGED